MPPPQFQFKVPQKSGQEMPTYEPISWDAFWDSQTLTDDGFLVYRAGPSGPTEDGSLRPYVFLLHGAGYSSLSWSLVAVRPSLLLFSLLFDGF